MEQLLGAYISVPFCRAKCSYCNFASGVLGAGASGVGASMPGSSGPDRMERYVERVCAEIRLARARAVELRAELPGRMDTVYFGGGTPSLLGAEQMRRIFAALRGEFEVTEDAEITIECAPGQMGDETLDELLRLGMNRVSFGVQSFVDAEARAVGRMHTREICLGEIKRMRAVGVEEINVDLIVGLPRQTAASWRESVDVAMECGVPHVSMYMLEVDEDSRLGREMLAHGTRYGAEWVASEDEVADRYAVACEWLEAGGVGQYEISNFARKGHESRHNVKYWRREPYVGFGLDAHSMLRCGEGAVRWGNTDDLSRYEVLGSRFEVGNPEVERIGAERGFEEAMFLGLRMNVGVDLEAMHAEFGAELMRDAVAALNDVEEAGLVEREGSWLRLTARGRMVSNEVFSRLLVVGCQKEEWR
ncbi:MAG: radical SAM family heme chaperone HemW [Acidobacteriaceae bacterium]